MTAPQVTPSDDELIAIENGTHTDPHHVLGAHVVAQMVVIRTRRPGAVRVEAVLGGGTSVELSPVGHGVWQGVLADTEEVPGYRVQAHYEWPDATGETRESTWVADDGYRYLPTVSDLDLYLFAHGKHESPWRFLGCRLISAEAAGESTAGAAFTVWAPHAQAARVVADFNGWNGAGHMMRRLGDSGVWELFVPGCAAGMPYKFELLTPDGRWVLRADPYARQCETPPHTASVSYASDFTWTDQAWMARQESIPHYQSPISIYEVHLGSWKPGMGYREIAPALIEHVTGLGFTHVEFLPLMEHPFGGSWGYQVTGYYAPTSRWGSPDDLKYLVNALHAAGIGVICDWVPAHFPRDEWALAQFDGDALYEYADPRRGEHPDWGTKVFDFGRNEVRNFLLGSALYWLDEFHIDGLRVDAVASMLYLDYSRKPGEWLPNVDGGRENYEAVSLLQQINATCYRLHPGTMMIAEESTSWPGVTRATDTGGLGFGFKWNMGWMHDSLEYVEIDPMWRAGHRDDITRSMLYAYSENYVLPISHDEVVHGKGSLVSKMPGDAAHRVANLRAYLGFMWAHPGKKLLFMGQEFAQATEWNEAAGLDWEAASFPANRGVQRLVSDLGLVYRHVPALWQNDSDPAGFSWLDAGSANVVAFTRTDAHGGQIASFTNFGGDDAHIRVSLPHPGLWAEIINTDARDYGGQGGGNLGGVRADSDGSPTAIYVPPLSTIWLAAPTAP
ncbi:MAG TPA: 1,4-alpha-glucan branching protein GlgB [Pseudoclavibacter sp.]|nr:1,4-alpha-glucan branching protein GlgB [Pseudoclavibacter sp.]